MDGVMYILKHLYDNLHMLVDTLINQIMQLPCVQTWTDGLRARFLNPLLESSKRLENLGFLVAYFLLLMTIAKISGELRGILEMEYGARTELHIFENFITFLEITVPTEDTQSRTKARGGRRSPRMITVGAI